jgi:2,4-dienoyl-CoA reductase-like NADH-dependent reductase (Old Yellow Enzyme family)
LNSDAPHLFTPLRIGGIELANRIVVSPMCQYAATDGTAGAWHRQHLGSLALSGAGLLILESTAVARSGRITNACLGLYADEHTRTLANVVDGINSFSPVALGIQLAHAGRKGSASLPWEGDGPLAATAGAWQTISASALPFDDFTTPTAASEDDIAEIIAAYVAAAHRAVRAGFSVIELHAAHGYLIHQFLSPLSNRRDDGYGGSARRRMRFALDVFEAVREVVPNTIAYGVRISGSDWHDDGANVEDAAAFAQALEKAGADYLCVSSGGLVPRARIAVGPGYQVPFASRVKQHVSVPVMAVGMIDDADVAETIVSEGRADFVALARAFLDDPRWGFHAARKLGADLAWPPRLNAVDPRNWTRSAHAALSSTVGT